VAGIRRIVKDRFYSFAMVLGIGFLLLLSLVLSAWLAAMGRFFRSFLPAPEPILEAATFLISFMVVRHPPQSGWLDEWDRLKGGHLLSFRRRAKARLC
jgi:hypothetical protein